VKAGRRLTVRVEETGCFVAFRYNEQCLGRVVVPFDAVVRSGVGPGGFVLLGERFWTCGRAEPAVVC
jgi:hypothetical protein